jgi:hypothetical protein
MQFSSSIVKSDFGFGFWPKFESKSMGLLKFLKPDSISGMAQAKSFWGIIRAFENISLKIPYFKSMDLTFYRLIF